MLIHGDSFQKLLTLKPKSVHAIATSPPYWQQREYAVGDTRYPAIAYLSRAGLTEKTVVDPWVGQLGMEPNMNAFVGHLVWFARLCRRVLREDGTLTINVGDTYWCDAPIRGESGEKIGRSDGQKRRKIEGVLKEGDLCMVPMAIAQALQADGWWVRDFYPWFKPNAMTDGRAHNRLTCNHEWVITLARSPKYYFDKYASKLEGINTTQDFWVQSTAIAFRQGDALQVEDGPVAAIVATGKRGKAHTASFPPELIRPILRSVSSDHGVCECCGKPWTRVCEKERSLKSAAMWRTVGWKPGCDCDAGVVPATILDPFAGSGTTMVEAIKLGRKAIGIEYSKESFEEARKAISLAQKQPLNEGVQQFSLLNPILTKVAG